MALEPFVAIRNFLLLALLAVMAGCVAAPTAPVTYDVSNGYFVNKDLSIAAEDGSFHLVGGQRFSTPFQTDMYGSSDRSHFFDRVDLLDPQILLAAGGKRVKLRLADGTELFGIIAFNRVFKENSFVEGPLFDFYKPSLRSYELNIPSDRISKAKTGRVSLAYEVFATIPADKSVTKRSRDFRSWLLLLSRDPL